MREPLFTTFGRSLATCRAQAQAYGSCISAKLPEVRGGPHHTTPTMVATTYACPTSHASLCHTQTCTLCLLLLLLQVEQGSCSREFAALRQCFYGSVRGPLI